MRKGAISSRSLGPPKLTSKSVINHLKLRKESQASRIHVLAKPAFFFLQPLYTNEFKSWFLAASAWQKISGPHSRLAVRQWSLPPDAKIFACSALRRSPGPSRVSAALPNGELKLALRQAKRLRSISQLLSSFVYSEKGGVRIHLQEARNRWTVFLHLPTVFCIYDELPTGSFW